MQSTGLSQNATKKCEKSTFITHRSEGFAMDRMIPHSAASQHFGKVKTTHVCQRYIQRKYVSGGFT